MALTRLLYRYIPLIRSVTLVCLLLGGLYLMNTAPRYTASVLLLIDSAKRAVSGKQDIASERLQDPGLVESQVEILKSETVALAVARDLKLELEPEFAGQRIGLFARVLNWFGSGGEETAQDRQRALAESLLAAVKVKRLGATYLLQLDYNGAEPTRAAAVANGFAAAYIAGELEAREQLARRASLWLSDRLTQLRGQALAADLLVQRFKADNNIVDTSRGLVNEQQLADVNAQWINARAVTAEAKARLDRILEVSSGDIVNATVAEALRSEVITRLRAQFLDVHARQTDLAARYGKDHAAVVNLQNQMTQITRSASEELRRLAEATRSDHEIAGAREQSLRASLDMLLQQANVSSQAQVSLRNLESAAESLRNTYDAFLQKFQEATQEQSFPISSARIITAATPPAKPAWPKAPMVMAAALALGLMLGCGAALLTEWLGRGFRTPDEVRAFTGLTYLGTLPEVAADKTRHLRRMRLLPVDPGLLGAAAPLMRQALNAPFSRFAESIRNVKVSLDLARDPHKAPIVGIVSAVPKEGKTTFAANLALMIARMGHRTLLIDADLHHPALTRALLPEARLGLMEWLDRRANLRDVIRRDRDVSLDFLPMVLNEPVRDAVAILNSPDIAELLQYATEYYEYVIVDLPAIVPVVDVKAAAHLFDHFVFVIDWGRTSRDVVRDALIAVEAIRERIVGIVLNRADPAELKRIEAYRGAANGAYYTDQDVY